MAEKFRFPLDRLLRIRQRRERQRQEALGQVLGKLAEQSERARRYDELIRQEHHQLRQGSLVGPLDTQRLAHHRRYVNSVMRGLMDVLCQRAATQQRSHQARAELLEAAKQRKALETLRDRRRRDWLRDVDRVETRALDEMGLRARPAGGAT